jgi:uncharacterized protein (TIGR02391 family)
VNLRTQISERLWEAVASAYDAGNYAHAVLESIHLLTTVLREKSGLDGDGNQLVGKALGGDDPAIRLNSLQTDTEKNIQKGFESILRGIYSAIRNPRSHETATDKREHADAIIYFVNYLLTVLGASKEVFTPDAFMERVRDPDFVDSTRYSSLLVDEVPPARLGDALIKLYKEREHVPIQKRGTLIKALLEAANDSQIGNFLSVVSDELKTTNNTAEIRTTLQFLIPEFWPRLNEAARLRIENKLITGIRNGKRTAGGTTEALATWANTFISVFTLRAEVSSALWLKLVSDDAEGRHYVVEYFFTQLPEVAISDREVSRTIQGIVKAVKGGDLHVRGAIVRYIDIFPESWQRSLVEALSELTDKDNPACVLVDGTPFLTKLKLEDFDDDIPF